MGNRIKRLSAVLCAAIICVQTALVSGGNSLFCSAGNAAVTEWSLHSGETPFLKSSSGGLVREITNAGINIPEYLELEDLSLEVIFEIKDTNALNSLSSGRVQLTQDKVDNAVLSWSLADRTLNIGDNTLAFKLSEANYECVNSERGFTVRKPINYFRIYSTVNAQDGNAVLKSVKLKDSRMLGLEFGDEKTADTYLQLGKTLSEIPQTIEVSIKSSVKITDNWVLRAGGDKADVIGGISKSSILVGKTDDTDTPGAEKEYIEFKSSGNTLTAFNNNLNINTGNYGIDRLAVAFWTYSETDGKLFEQGQIRISNKSSGEDDKPNLSYPANAVNVQAGWNYIELPLSEFTASGGFDLADGINTFRIHGCKNTVNIRTQRICEIKLVVSSDTERLLRAGDNKTNIIGGLKANDMSYGITSAADAPGAGLRYTEFTSDNKTFTTYVNNLGIDISKYAVSDLSLAFWTYSETDGKLFEEGKIRISNKSSGEDDKPILSYDANKISVKAGWNYIVIPLNKFKAENGFDFSAGINTFRIHGCLNKTNVRIQRLGDFKIVDTNSIEAKDTVAVTESVDSLSLESNYMIFSNTNKPGDGGRYALFVTEKGYPSLLYGDKQFTLIKNIFTGEWVDIAAVRDSDGYIGFYINGDFVAKSTVKADSIKAPGIIHRIGADALGGQIMKGYISDIRIWKTARTAEEIKNGIVPKTEGTIENGLNKDTNGLIGSWPLLGNIEYVTKKMNDVSSAGNDAAFRGSRADDWLDYSKPECVRENYWSLVFVPDMRTLTKNDKYNEAWLATADWIAENAQKENIKHVIAGGSYSYNKGEAAYKRALKGFGLFNNDISWSALAGNLDYAAGTGSRNTALYQKYLGKSAIEATAASAYYSGCFEDDSGASTTENSYYRFNANHIKWMILQLEAYPRQSVLDWAKSVLAQYPDDNVILATSEYIVADGNYSVSDSAGYGGGVSTSDIWDALKECNNIKMILSSGAGNGTGAVAVKTENNISGGSVPVFAVSAADVDETYYTYKPLGMLGIIRISGDGKKAALQYYSPSLKKSFSPEYGGVSDSNRHIIQIEVKSCSHTAADGTSMLVMVNENAATEITNGYTGDMYCPECEELISVGSLVRTVSNSSDNGNETSGSTTDENYMGDFSNDKPQSDKPPKTGDMANPAVWLTLLIVSASAVYIIGRRCTKNGRR